MKYTIGIANIKLLHRLVLVLILGLCSTLNGQNAAPQKYALLVGVTNYEHASMNGSEPLKYPEDDAKAIGELLNKHGYEVDLLTGAEATYLAIQQKLDGLIRKGNAQGIVFVGFFGHGVQVEVRQPATTSSSIVGCFCPYDTAVQYVFDKDGKPLFDDKGKKLTEPAIDTLIKMSDVAESLANAKAQTRFMIADCCRNLPNRARGRNLGFGANFSTDKLPTQTVMLFGCKPGEQSLELDELRHGAFTKALLEEIPAMLELGPVTTGTLADRVKQRVWTMTGGKQSPVPISLDSIDLKLMSSAGSKQVALIAAGQRLTETERNERRAKAARKLELLDADQSASELKKDPDAASCVTYIRGKLYGVGTLSFRLADPNTDALPYIAELAAIDRRRDTELYSSKAQQLADFLAEHRYDIMDTPTTDAEAYIRGGRDTAQVWKTYFEKPRSSAILSAFSQDIHRVAPPLIRPLLSITNEKQRREQLPSDPKDPTDRAVIASLYGDYTKAVAAGAHMSHCSSAVVAPILLGDIESSIKIINSLSPSMRNAAVVLAVDTLLDEGRVTEARKMLERLDASKPFMGSVSDIPQPLFQFNYAVSIVTPNPFAYIAGRMNDDQLLNKVISAQPNFEDLEIQKRAVMMLHLAFAAGLVTDL